VGRSWKKGLLRVPGPAKKKEENLPRDPVATDYDQTLEYWRMNAGAKLGEMEDLQSSCQQANDHMDMGNRSHQRRSRQTLSDFSKSYCGLGCKRVSRAGIPDHPRACRSTQERDSAIDQERKAEEGHHV